MWLVAEAEPGRASPLSLALMAPVLIEGSSV